MNMRSTSDFKNNYTAQVWEDPLRDEPVPALQRAFHAELCGREPHSGRDDGDQPCEGAYSVFEQWNLEAALLRGGMSSRRR